ncbi:hypothetical protein HOLleu_07125 [Holothuria leucospilota]|uniref:Uncharacterized protein n=1 Tax=Holothuria leucospilota TaxID=206669 RepID=A0A9Q1CG79_HOLLE|nr:hypothetical protein HOLleu_07125 [Holothuria leucospilota]
MGAQVAEVNQVSNDSNTDEVNQRNTHETVKRSNELYNLIPTALMNEHMQLTRRHDHLRRRLTEINRRGQEELDHQNSKFTELSRF